MAIERLTRSYVSKSQPPPKKKKDDSSNNVIGSSYTPKPGESPYERYVEKRDRNTGKSAHQQFVENVQTANQLAQKELHEAFTSKSPERLQQAIQTGIQRKEQARTTQLMQASAIGDLMQAGFVEHRADVVGYDNGKPVYGDPYLKATERVKNLGEERFYEFEENAVWGKSFDFLIGKDDKLLMFPQGTRKTLKESGIEEPLFVDLEGETYLVAQREGKDTIKLAPLDPLGFRLGKPQEVNISRLVEEQTGEAVPKEVSIDYALRGDSISLVPTAHLAGHGFRSSVGKPKTDQEQFMKDATKLLEERGFGKQPLRVEIQPGILKTLELLSPDVKAESQFLLKTPETEFFATEYSRDLEGFVRGVEDRTGLYLKNTPLGDVRVSPGVGFAGSVVENALIKPVVGGAMIAKVGIYTGLDVTGFRPMGKEEKFVAANIVGASLPAASFLPLTVVTVKAQLGGNTAKTVAVDPLTGKAIGGEVAKYGVKEAAKGIGKTALTFAEAQTAIDLTVIAGSEKYHGAPYEPKATHPRLKETEKLNEYVNRVANRWVESGGPGRTVTAGVGGGILGFANYGVPLMKDKLVSAGKSAKASLVQRTQHLSGEYVLKGAEATLQDVKLEASILKMTAKTARSDLSAVPMDSPIFLEAELTKAGANPLSAVYQPQPLLKVKVQQPAQISLMPVMVAPQPLPSSKPPMSVGYGLMVRQRAKGKVSPSPDPFALATVTITGIPQSIRTTGRQAEIRLEAITQDIAGERGRHIEEQKAALEQAMKLGVLQGQGLLTRQGLRSPQASKLALESVFLAPVQLEVTSQLEIPLQKYSFKFKQPPRLPPGVIPTIGLGFGDRGKRRTSLVMGTPTKAKFAPSLAGFELGVSQKSTRGEFTGFEIRGLPKRKRKKGLRDRYGVL